MTLVSSKARFKRLLGGLFVNPYLDGTADVTYQL